MLKSVGMDVLGNHGWLAQTPALFRASVLKYGDLIRLKRGQTFFLAGDEGGGIYGVAAGRLEIHIPCGVEGATLAFIGGVGHWFGEISAIGGGPRLVSIVAGTETSLLRLSRANMQRITEQDPAAWQHFAKLLAMNMSIAMSVVTALRCEQPLQRVAVTLDTLADGDAAGAIRIVLSQSDLAALTGLSRNTVNLALGELEKWGVVRRQYGRVEIIDRKALQGVRNTAKP